MQNEMQNNPPTENPNVEQQYRAMTVIWFALLVSQLMFLFILFFIKPEVYRFDFSAPPLGESSAIIIVFAFLAVAVVALSFVLKRNFLNRAIAAQNAGLVQSALIVACALCEAASLLGFVLAVAFAYQYFFVWFIAGILGIILHFPQRADLISASYKR